jgi:hypothetical protein
MATRSVNSRHREHIFYTGLAALFALTVFVWFSRTYYVKGLFGTPRLSWIAHLYGAVFTLWVLFFVLQTALVSTRRISLHRSLEWVGAAFAGGIVTLGAVMAMHSVRAGYASGRPNMLLLLINSIIDLILFCIFFAGALFLRRNRELHKRLMMLAMVSLIIPAISRLPIPSRAIGWVIFGFPLLTVIYDALFLRRAFLITIVGVLLINISSPLRFMIAANSGWQSFAPLDCTLKFADDILLLLSERPTGRWCAAISPLPHLMSGCP